MKFTKKYIGALCLSSWICTAIAPLAAEDIVYPNACYCGSLDDYTASWIANDGGTSRTHIPHNMESMFVLGNGLAATVTGWDEGGTNVGVFDRNGTIVAIPEYSGTGSYGRYSGKAVAMDENYIYQLMRFIGNKGGKDGQLNSNGLLAFPPSSGTSMIWQVLCRYDLKTGRSSVFPTGYGPMANMLKFAETEARQALGVAVTDKYVLVSVPGDPSVEGMTDSIMVFDKTTMTGVRNIKVSQAGYIYADKKGFVWMKEGNQVVPYNIENGAIRERSVITLPENTDIRSFSIDTRSGSERILMANSGVDLNVLIYTGIYTNPTLSSTFGVTGGIFSTEGGYKKGQVGPLRFEGPTGVGVDDYGNIYVSNMFVHGSGSVLHCYDEATKELKWKREGLVFTAVADFDNTIHNRVFCTERMYELDYSKTGTRMDKLIASTVDPFTYPRDMRLEPNPPYPLKTSTFKRHFNGKDYLFVSNMYSTGMAGYRFDEEKYGYIAVPFLKILADQTSFWNDKNGDGQEDPDEIAYTKPNGATFSQYVDHAGNIWMADRSTQPACASFRLWRIAGEQNGVIQYGPETVYAFPPYVTDISRVLYDSERDEMIIACYTTKRPFTNTSLWGECGTTILTYKNAMKRLEANEDPATWTHDLEILIPWNTADRTDTKAMTFAGDYIFCQLQGGGVTNMYHRETGDFAGQVTITDIAEKKSGWTDFCFAVNARANADGTYEILAEENLNAKVMHYKINSMKSSMIKLGDLYPYRIQVLNNSGATFAAQEIHEGDPIRLQVWVKNIEKGPVTYRRASTPTRCLVRFRIYDTDTDELVYTGVSDPYQRDIAGGETLCMTLGEGVELWKYKSGNYRLEVDVNYQNWAKECNTDNNVAEVEFGGVAQPSSSVSDPETSEVALKVYPTVASHTVYVSGKIVETAYTAYLTSAEGKVVLEKHFFPMENGALDVSDLMSGLYMLRVVSEKQNCATKIIVRN